MYNLVNKLPAVDSTIHLTRSVRPERARHGKIPQMAARLSCTMLLRLSQ